MKIAKPASRAAGVKIEINNRTKSQPDLNLIRRVVKKFFSAYQLRAKEISLALIGDSEMKKINLAYRGRNKPTDILSFAGEGDFLGELVIDYAQIKKQAGRFGNSPKQELVFILVHGLLHLVGYDDRTESQRLKMVKLGEEFIKKMKI